jgi:hypothetical protein
LGKTVFKKQLWRDQMAEFFVNLPGCLSQWRPVADPITGRVSCKVLATPSN